MQFHDEVCIEHLGGMLRCRTLSDPVTADMDFEPFYELHRYLEKTYPLTHATLKREIIGPAALLYHWKGAGKGDLLPVMYTAHQDVVPAGDPDKWEYPPFDGVIAEGYLWGRGATDDKNVIMAHFEAIEALIADGFQPDFDVYLGYGFNEEVMGGDWNSAAAICRTLQARGVRLGCLIDEGRGPGRDARNGIEAMIIDIKVGEKGYADYEVYLEDAGGHSMAPGKRSIVAELGAIAADLHKNQFPYRVTEFVRAELEAKAPLMPDREEGRLFSDISANLDQIIHILDQRPGTACKFHTTMAMTMMSASPQANILPTRAAIVVNCRILEGDTLESVQAHLERVVADRAKVRLLKGVNPTPASRVDSRAYRCLSELYREMNPGILVAPCIITGGTDARNYCPVCDSVYRCGGFPGGELTRAHNYNERLEIKNCGRAPEFFARFLVKYNDFER